MTASTSLGCGPQRSRLPLWRRKANYVLRELVRAWHGMPYDTAVVWGFRFALDDIVHTFAKENKVDFPKLCYWFNQAWLRVAECFGKRAFSIQDWQRFGFILGYGCPENMQLTSDEHIEEILFLASRIYLREDGYAAKQFGDYCLRHPLAYYETLEVAPLDSFTIWYAKRIGEGFTET